MKNDKTYTTFYYYPSSSKPYNEVYDYRNKLPLYSKGKDSQCMYCAGYYAIQIGNRWKTIFCPKLIILERYKFNGPFRTKEEVVKVVKNIKQTV